MLRRWKARVCSHPSLPLTLSFRNCTLSEKVGLLLCAELLRRTQTSVLPLWGIGILEKAQCAWRQLCGSTPIIWQKSNGSMIQTHKHTWGRSSTGIVLQTCSPFVAGWHSLPHTALTDLIYTESNPLVCLRNNYIFVVWIGWLPLRFVTPSCKRLCINQCLGGLEREQLYLLCFLASSTSCTRG